MKKWLERLSNQVLLILTMSKPLNMWYYARTHELHAVWNAAVILKQVIKVELISTDDVSRTKILNWDTDRQPNLWHKYTTPHLLHTQTHAHAHCLFNSDVMRSDILQSKHHQITDYTDKRLKSLSCVVQSDHVTAQLHARVTALTVFNLTLSLTHEHSTERCVMITVIISLHDQHKVCPDHLSHHPSLSLSSAVRFILLQTHKHSTRDIFLMLHWALKHWVGGHTCAFRGSPTTPATHTHNIVYCTAHTVRVCHCAVVKLLTDLYCNH